MTPTITEIVADLRLNAIQPFLAGNVAVKQYVTDAANELERLDAARPTCPTCGGESIVGLPSANNVIASAYTPCPDCTDGRMPFERMARIVAAVFEPELSLLEWPEQLVDYLRSIR